MNPFLYEATDINKSVKKTALEIWDRDLQKYARCKENGIDLLTIWELDWIENKENVKNDLLLMLL